MTLGHQQLYLSFVRSLHLGIRIITLTNMVQVLRVCYEYYVYFHNSVLKNITLIKRLCTFNTVYVLEKKYHPQVDPCILTQQRYCLYSVEQYFLL